MFLTTAPYQQYFDENGDPLDAGAIYFGQPNQNPETAPIAVFWDEAGTQPVAQPVQTMNGYAVRSGTPASLFSGGDYSTTIKNRRGSLIAYSPSSSSFAAQIANSTDSSKGAGLVGYKLNATGSVGRTVASKLDEHVSVKDFGAVGNGVADDTTAFNAALAVCTCVYVPAGTYKISGSIAMVLSGQSLIGEGRDVVTITSTSASLPNITLLGGVPGFRIEGMMIVKSVAGTAGGHGISFLGSTNASILRGLEVRNCFIGISLGACDEGMLDNVTCRGNWSHGIFNTNAASYGPCQWRMKQVLCSSNVGDGIRISVTTGPAGLIMGCWDTVETYANSGAGVSLLGNPTTPIFDFRLTNGFLGSDNTAGINFDTYGGKHRVMSTFIERAGRDATGPTFSTPGSNVAHGIAISANNTDVSISSCLIDECSLNGIIQLGGLCVVSGCTIYNNGAALTAGQRNGISTTGGRISVCGGALTNLGSALQAYGFSTTHDNFVVTGVDLSNNATGPYNLGLIPTWGTIAGNFAPFVSNYLPGTIEKLTFNIGRTPSAAFSGAETLNVVGGLLKNGVVYNNP